jgi:ferric-dicitrate binding protein FerR (iron transport regulator)
MESAADRQPESDRRLDARVQRVLSPAPFVVERVVRGALEGDGPPPRHVRRRLVIAAATLSLVLVLGGGFWWRSGVGDTPVYATVTNEGEIVVVELSDGTTHLIGPRGGGPPVPSGEGFVITLGEVQ